MCALFAATYPERTRSLVLMGSYARRQSAPDYAFGLTSENSEQLLKDIESKWGTPLDIDRRIPSSSSNERFRRWWAKFMRAGASPASAVALMKMNFDIDVRPILPSIRVPSLILHATGDRIVDIEAGRYLAKQIPNARLVEFDAVDHVPFGDSMNQVIDEIEQFVTGRSTDHVEDRVVSTIMFTDIVDSTRVAAEMGDAAWRDSLEAHHSAVRAELDRFRGTEIKTTGDGFHATFDGPARAIRCGQAICQSVESLGLRVRVGIHTGECVRTGDELEGIAVHIAARIGALAEAGQVFVSQTVRDLVAGSGIVFVSRGAHRLKGVEGEWSVYTARHSPMSV